MSACDECFKLQELGTFNVIEEDDGTQFCFCDACKRKLLREKQIERVVVDDETIFRRRQVGKL